MAAVVEHHLSKARKVLITLVGKVSERDDGGTALPPALRLSPLRDGSCARLAQLLRQRSEHLYAKPVTGAPVTDIPLIKEAREPRQLGMPVYGACRQEDLLKEKDASELVLTVVFFE